MNASSEHRCYFRHALRLQTLIINELFLLMSAEQPLLPSTSELTNNFVMKNYLADVTTRLVDGVAKLEEKSLWNESVTYTAYAREAVDLMATFPTHLEGLQSYSHQIQQGPPSWEKFLGWTVGKGRKRPQDSRDASQPKRVPRGGRNNNRNGHNNSNNGKKKCRLCGRNGHTKADCFYNPASPAFEYLSYNFQRE